MRKVVLFLLYLTGIQYIISSITVFSNGAESNVLLSLVYLIGGIAGVLLIIFTYYFQKKEIMQIPIICMLLVQVSIIIIGVVNTPGLVFEFIWVFILGVNLLITLFLCIYLFRSRTYLML